MSPPRLLLRLREERRPLRFLASRVLWHTGLGARLGVRTRFAEGFSVRLHPAALAATVWLDPGYVDDDLAFLRRTLRAGDRVVDVGANIGVLTLAAARHVGPAGAVVAVEAHPRTVAFLRENVADDGALNVTVHHAAAGADPGELRFSDCRSDDQNAVDSEGEIAVPARRLDDLVPPGRVTLLKIDVEGFERFVLRGAGEVLASTELLYLECDDRLTRRYGYTGADLIDELAATGFTVYRVAGQDLVPVVREEVGRTPVNLVAARDPRELFRRWGGAAATAPP
jgi:FkbM family methyltransferase